MAMVGIALQNPDCPFNILVLTSILSSVGGSSFVSSMGNYNFSILETNKETLLEWGKAWEILQ